MWVSKLCISQTREVSKMLPSFIVSFKMHDYFFSFLVHSQPKAGCICKAEAKLVFCLKKIWRIILHLKKCLYFFSLYIQKMIVLIENIFRDLLFLTKILILKKKNKSHFEIPFNFFLFHLHQKCRSIALSCLSFGTKCVFPLASVEEGT